MPLLFPSHQGLILPLWRRYPAHIDPIALSIGAAAPDLVDAFAWPIRGWLGQGIGHSLLGLVLLCTPAAALLALVARRWSRSAAPLSRITLSGLVGAASHLVFDFISHGNLLLFHPWHEDRRWFPAWWYHAWGRIDLLVYEKPYPVAPHTLVWIGLSILGAVLFGRIVRSRAGSARG